MKILLVTNMYPGRRRDASTQGIFVKEQVEAIGRTRACTVDIFSIDGFRGKFAYLLSIFPIVWRVWHGKYDVVHYHFGLSACSAPLVKKLTSAAVVITFHGSDVMGAGLMRQLSLLFSKFADISIAVSAEIKSKISNSSARCRVIPCAVNEILFRESPDKLPVKRQCKTVVFPSSPLRPEKDYQLFKNVTNILSSKYLINIEERHIDGLDRHEVRDLLDRADCLVMTSKREGSPQAIKEAMAMNLPIVTVDVGDVRQLLTGCDGNEVIDGRDPGVLAEAVARILGREARSKGRIRLAELKYFSDDVAGEIVEIYKSVTP
ncbi:glycosyltransferase [Paraburkholderia bannensis]|uniref:glycosyltransferase n=1 Tax=Paraburkholderia bannensis TaxID=765414 RepID=UPI0012EB4819|nr:glycosyltransferase [Paraburkholderia bannensis]